MATENVLLAAALTPGTTVIGNAACEPHVQDLARMLVKMGADIQGIGSNLLTVTGPSACADARTTSPPTTSRSAPSWLSRASLAENSASRTPFPPTCA